jgi:hypothetical protein
VLILDAKRNRYFGLDRGSSNALSTVVADWPKGQLSSAVQQPRPENVDEAIHHMTHRGLLTTDSTPRKSIPNTLAPATSSYLREDAEDDCPLTLLERLRFVAACIKVRALLSLRTLDKVLGRLETRKVALLSSHSLDMSVARHLTQVHIRMRCFVYTAREHCLYDSLVLVEFLSYFNQFPELVIGVTTGPFKAHCWVQYAGLVFNDDYDRVRDFTPILVK